MRIALAGSIVVTLFGAACVSAVGGGTLGEGATRHPTITSVDSAFPPRAASVQMAEPGYAAVFLVAPGHSATLLYPPDSIMDNQLTAGSHRLQFEVPSVLAQSDSERVARAREAARGSVRTRMPGARAGRDRAATPIPATVPTFLLLLTSPQPLVYEKMIEKTGGVSIPNIDSEALNAVAKAIKSTLPNEPREWAGHYVPIELRERR